jgi:dihydropteroate synthase
MGVVNATPDSFSDGGRFFGEAAAVSHALALLDAGADILDVGGESTRPGAELVSKTEELDRIVPVVAAIRRARPDAVISIDTMKPEVMRAAAQAGAQIWNDVTALAFAPDSLATAAELGCGVVLMHMQGEPRSMQADPRYDDVVGEVRDFLAARAEAAMAAGVARGRIWLDPGLGFGKTVEHNLALLGAIPELKALGFPVLIGASRKSLIARLDPLGARPEERLGGSLALALWSAAQGADVVRVHDVRETAQALAVWGAVSGRSRP